LEKAKKEVRCPSRFLAAYDYTTGREGKKKSKPELSEPKGFKNSREKGMVKRRTGDKGGITRTHHDRSLERKRGSAKRTMRSFLAWAQKGRKGELGKACNRVPVPEKLTRRP